MLDGELIIVVPVLEGLSKGGLQTDNCLLVGVQDLFVLEFVVLVFA